MGRKRLYETAAARQKAYRERVGIAPQPNHSVPEGKRRQPSRPKLLAELDEKVNALLASYEDWRNQMPESLESSAQVEKLTDTVEKLGAVAEMLADIDPPLGFGRD